MENKPNSEESSKNSISRRVFIGRAGKIIALGMLSNFVLLGKHTVKAADGNSDCSSTGEVVCTGTVTMECESHSPVHCYAIKGEGCIYSPDTCNHPQATVCSGEEAPEPECALWGLTDLCVWSDWCIISE